MSCGCLRKDLLVKRNTKHGHAARTSKTPEYFSWISMLSRVRNPKHKDSHIYANINICKRWLIYENFLKDMGNRPKGTTLDRRNGLKGYCKNNCRWATALEQANNTARNKIIVYKGIEMSMANAARAAGLSQNVVSDRINKLGWPVEKALATPKRKLVRG